MNLQIRFIDFTEYKEAESVWAECFPEDSREYIDCYFSTRTSPEYVLAAFSDGKMIGDMHILPQTLRLFGRNIPIGFVSGVATLPQYRRKGVASALFEVAFDYMKQKGYEATVLQPFDPVFYAKYGYRPFVYRQYVKTDGDASHTKITNELSVPDAEFMLNTYDRFMHDRDGYAIRDLAYCNALIAEYSQSDARAIRLKDAYALLYTDESSAYVCELCGERASIDELVRALCAEYTHIEYPLPADFSPARAPSIAFNCLCAFNEKCLLSGTGYSSIDEAAADNAGRFYSFDRY